MITRLLSPLRLFAVAVCAAALIFGLSAPPRAQAADDRLQFTGTTLSGAPFNGAGLQGKPAVLWFWAPFCPFCNAEAPGVSSGGGGQSRCRLRRDRRALGCRCDAGLCFQVQPELHQSQRRRRLDLGPLQRALAAGLRVLSGGRQLDVRQQPTSAMPQDELAGRVAALTHYPVNQA